MVGGENESSTQLNTEQNLSFASKIVHCLKWNRGINENQHEFLGYEYRSHVAFWKITRHFIFCQDPTCTSEKLLISVDAY